MKSNNGNTRSNVLFSAVVLNIITLILFLTCFNREYKQPQDIFMSEILSSDLHSHLIFYNLVIGKILQQLIILLPQTFWSWYSVFQYSVVFISLLIITYLNLKRNHQRLGLILVIAFDLVVGFECYCQPSFMKTAVIATASSSYLLLNLWKEESNNYLKCLSITIWWAASGLICTSLFWLAAIFLGIQLLYTILINRTKSYHLIYFFIGLILMGTCTYIDAKGYISEEEWSYVGTYKQELVELVNYGWPDCETFQKEIQDMGYTEDEYNSISTAYYLGVSSNDIINIANLKNKLMISKMAIKSFGREFGYVFTHDITILFSILFIILFLLSSSADKYRKIVILCLGLMGVIIGGYWFKLKIADGISMAIALGIIIYIYLQTDSFANVTIKKVMPYLCVIFLFIIMNLGL